jgi:hypothetical protein
VENVKEFLNVRAGGSRYYYTMVFVWFLSFFLYGPLDRTPDLIDIFVERFLQSWIIFYVLLEDRDRTSFRSAVF